MLRALDAATLQAFYGDLLTGGRKAAGTSKRLSAKSVRNVAGIIGKALGDAAKWRLVAHNVARDAELPRVEAPELRAWTADEAGRFLAATGDDRLGPLWAVALGTGMRRGEVLGLRWADVDMTAATVTVSQARVVAGMVTTGRPKTKAGARVIGLGAFTLAALRAWRRTQAAERLAAGPAWTDTGYVFTNELGAPLHPLAVTRAWSRAVRASSVPLIRLHDARHTHATLALAAGTSVKVLAQRLGHADVAVTLRVHAHATRQDDETTATAVDGLLYGHGG